MPTFHVSPLTRLALVMGSVVLVTIGWLGFVAEPPQRQRARERDGAGTAGTRTTIDEFLSYAAGTPGDNVPPFGRDHAYTAEGIRRLAAALDALPAVKRHEPSAPSGTAPSVFGAIRPHSIMRTSCSTSSQQLQT